MSKSWSMNDTIYLNCIMQLLSQLASLLQFCHMIVALYKSTCSLYTTLLQHSYIARHRDLLKTEGYQKQLGLFVLLQSYGVTGQIEYESSSQLASYSQPLAHCMHHKILVAIIYACVYRYTVQQLAMFQTLATVTVALMVADYSCSTGTHCKSCWKTQNQEIQLQLKHMHAISYSYIGYMQSQFQ